MESVTSVVGWHWYHCDGNHIDANYECWWYATFKISNNDSSEKILPKSKEIALRLILVYTTLTIFCATSYKIFGMNFFDSITHSMTTIATGGFSNYNESLGFFNSRFIESSAIIFILLGSIPFISYIKFLNGDREIFSKIYKSKHF